MVQVTYVLAGLRRQDIEVAPVKVVGHRGHVDAAGVVPGGFLAAYLAQGQGGDGELEYQGEFKDHGEADRTTVILWSLARTGDFKEQKERRHRGKKGERRRRVLRLGVSCLSRFFHLPFLLHSCPGEERTLSTTTERSVLLCFALLPAGLLAHLAWLHSSVRMLLREVADARSEVPCVTLCYAVVDENAYTRCLFLRSFRFWSEPTLERLAVEDGYCVFVSTLL